MLSDEDDNFNLLNSISHNLPSHEITLNDSEYSNIKNHTNPELTQYQKEISKYERKISLPGGNYKYRGNTNYHFEFHGSTSETKISEIKRKSQLDIEKISLFRKKIESNSLYVVFENNYGENSCYINVVLHFLYVFPCINEYLIKLYLNNKDNINISNNNITNLNNLEFFFFLLGKTLFEYQNVLSNLDNKGITILHTTELRQYLDIISNNIYEYNKVADPVELLSFLINIINENNQSEIHRYFFIDLIEELQCEQCKNKISKKYDKDNFIYHIYVDEIMNFIHQNNLHFQNYNRNLFQISQCSSLNYFKNCEKCNNQIKKILKCNGPDYPIFLLINCIWNNPQQSLKNIIKFLYILPLEECMENLFFCNNNNNNSDQKTIYNLLGMILYSPALSHYINVMFNIQKNIFVLYNDDKVKELNSIHEVYKEITLEQIKYNNPNVYFYPVLLIYYKEIIYDDMNTIKNNIYTYQKYHFLVEECMRAKKEKEIILTDEQKKQNYIELIKAQMQFERRNNNYLNLEKDNNNLGSSSLYKVNEEIDDEKCNKSNPFKRAIDENDKDKNDNSNNNDNKNNINNFNNSNIYNLNNININNKININGIDGINDIYNNDNDNMNITQVLNNNNNIKKNKSEPINENKINLDKKNYKDNNNNNINNNLIENNNYKIYNSVSSRLVSETVKDDIDFRRRNKKYMTDSQNYHYRTSKHFFNNIL